MLLFVYIFNNLNYNLTRPLNKDSVKLTLGFSHSCSSTLNKRINCWGSNYYGQLNIPIRYNNIELISSGLFHTCMVKKQIVDYENYIYENYDYYLRKFINKLKSKQEFIDQIESNDHIASRYIDKIDNDYLISFDKTKIHCWGLNQHGQTDIPKTINRFVYFLTAGNNFTCSGSIKSSQCWGLNNLIPKQIKIPLLLLKSGYETICLVPFNKYSLFCYGDNKYGQIQVPSILKNTQIKPIDVVMGYRHTCALKILSLSTYDGKVTQLTQDILCWGSNDHGQISIPVELRKGVQLVKTGHANTCVTMAYKGRTSCHGLDLYRQTAVPQGKREGVVALECGFNHICAASRSGNEENGDVGSANKVKEDGAGVEETEYDIECWGFDREGQTKVELGQD
eukprot:Mrub_04259.p1 GENE.Mrub_04259~~Mrub_04259.p1  ORF type:complete len:395 (+),score=73.12 Mrub_04259:2-1186(+)